MALGPNIAASATAIASFSYPPGEGIQPSLMNNGSYNGGPSGFDYAPFETYEAGVPHTEDWVGLQFGSPQHIARIEWQTGGDWYGDGGYWTSGIVVEHSDDGVTWTAATNLVIAEIDAPGGTPTGNPYPYSTAAWNFKNYRASFDYPNPGKTRFRIRGATANAQGFVAVAELFAYAEESPAGSGIVAPSLAARGAFGLAGLTLVVAPGSLAASTAFGLAVLSSADQISAPDFSARAGFGQAALGQQVAAPSLAATAAFGTANVSSQNIVAPALAARSAFGTAVVAVDVQVPLIGGMTAFGNAVVAPVIAITAPSHAVQAAFGPVALGLTIEAPSFAAEAAFGDTNTAGPAWITAPGFRADAAFGATAVAAEWPVGAPAHAARAAFGLATVRTDHSISAPSLAAQSAFGAATLDVQRLITAPGFRATLGSGQAALASAIEAPTHVARARFGQAVVGLGIAAESFAATAGFGACSLGHQILGDSCAPRTAFGLATVTVAPPQWIICGALRAEARFGPAAVLVDRVLTAPPLAAASAFGHASVALGIACTPHGATASFGAASVTVLPASIAGGSLAARARFGPARVSGGRRPPPIAVYVPLDPAPPIDVDF